MLGAGPVELRWLVTAYALAPGAVGFVTRPSAGPFESFAAVYNRGSEVAARVRWTLGRGLSLFGYYRAPWPDGVRAYVGVRYHR